MLCLCLIQPNFKIQIKYFLRQTFAFFGKVLFYFSESRPILLPIKEILNQVLVLVAATGWLSQTTTKYCQMMSVAPIEAELTMKAFSIPSPSPPPPKKKKKL